MPPSAMNDFATKTPVRLLHHTLNFNDTETAFASKSNTDLKRSVLLFKAMGSPSLVNLGAFGANLSFKIGLPIEWAIKQTLYKQFVGGETIAACKSTIQNLWQSHVGTILDYSVEGEESEVDFEACFKELLRTVEAAKTEEAIPFCVFKVTGLGNFSILEKVSQKQTLTADETASFERTTARVAALCQAAANADVRIFIDAEESWIQPAIDEFALYNMRMHNRHSAIVYNTAQMYRHDRFAYVKDLLEMAKDEEWHVGLKLVRGAYMEKERARATRLNYQDPIQPDKKATDKDYDNVVALCLEHIAFCAICAGSHNEESSRILAEQMEFYGIQNNDTRVFFSQLLGMSDNLSFVLADSGYNVAKYVPYGPVKSVFPYLIRRAQENTSISGQVGRELGLLLKEQQRRRKKGRV